jgi:hypothetical protein
VSLLSKLSFSQFDEFSVFLPRVRGRCLGWCFDLWSVLALSYWYFLLYYELGWGIRFCSRWSVLILCMHYQFILWGVLEQHPNVKHYRLLGGTCCLHFRVESSIIVSFRNGNMLVPFSKLTPSKSVFCRSVDNCYRLHLCYKTAELHGWVSSA